MQVLDYWKIAKKASLVLDEAERQTFTTSAGAPSWWQAICCIGWAHLDPHKALDQFARLVQRLEISDGVPGHQTFPLWGYVAGRLAEQVPANAHPEAWRHIYRQLSALHRQWWKAFDLADDGLLVLPTEAPCQDVGFNAIWLLSNEHLIHLGGALKADLFDLLHFHELALYSFNENFWDPDQGQYLCYDTAIKQRIPSGSIRNFWALASGAPTQEEAEALCRQLHQGRFAELELKYTTWEMDHQELRQEQPWRGAISVLSNWLMGIGLFRFDMEQEAEDLVANTLEWIAHCGFCAHFEASLSPDGERWGIGSPTEPWVAALYLDLMSAYYGELDHIR